MVSYVNVHAILDGRRACAKGSATNAGSSQVVFMLIKSTLKFFLCISLFNILGFCHETSKPSMIHLHFYQFGLCSFGIVWQFHVIGKWSTHVSHM